MKFTQLPILSEVSVFHVYFKKRLPMHVPGRSFASLSFRIGGNVSISGSGFHLRSDPDSITFVPQGCSYNTQTMESGDALVMHFRTESNCGGVPMVAPVPYPKMFYNLFENASRRYAYRGCDLALMSMAYQILSESEAVFTPSAYVPSWLIECKKYIDENISDPTLRIHELATQCGVSEVLFRKEFARCYGNSPLEYIKKRRIETAKFLMQTGLYSVTDIAFRSGFESSSYFSAEFRRLAGVSPREYIKSQLL